MMSIPSAKLQNKIEFVYGGIQERSSVKSTSPLWAMQAKNDSLILTWPKAIKIGAGLKNQGNTCQLNSVLQCLSQTIPLHNYLRAKTHSKNCTNSKQFCVFCYFEKHLEGIYNENVLWPNSLVKNIHVVSPRFANQDMHDSHEFLRFLLDSMIKSISFEKNTKKEDISIINRIFEGTLLSVIKCQNCNGKSSSSDVFQDISLVYQFSLLLFQDLIGSESLEKSIENFFKKEELVGDNKYFCSKCKQKSNASKQFFIRKNTWNFNKIEKSPVILTAHFKRFTRRFVKITKFVSFPLTIDLNKQCIGSENEKIRQNLYAVLVHMGMTLISGHYQCQVKNTNGAWYLVFVIILIKQMDDEQVRVAGVNEILKEHAQLLFYQREIVKESNTMPLCKEINNYQQKKSTEKSDTINAKNEIKSINDIFEKRNKMGKGPATHSQVKQTPEYKEKENLAKQLNYFVEKSEQKIKKLAFSKLTKLLNLSNKKNSNHKSQRKQNIDSLNQIDKNQENDASPDRYSIDVTQNSSPEISKINSPELQIKNISTINQLGKMEEEEVDFWDADSPTKIPKKKKFENAKESVKTKDVWDREQDKGKQKKVKMKRKPIQNLFQESFEILKQMKRN